MSNPPGKGPRHLWGHSRSNPVFTLVALGIKDCRQGHCPCPKGWRPCKEHGDWCTRHQSRLRGQTCERFDEAFRVAERAYEAGRFDGLHQAAIHATGEIAT